MARCDDETSSEVHPYKDALETAVGSWSGDLGTVEKLCPF